MDAGILSERALAASRVPVAAARLRSVPRWITMCRLKAPRWMPRGRIERRRPLTTPPDSNRGVPRPRLRWFLLSAALVMATAGALWFAQAEVVLVTSEKNGEVPVASYALREDDFNNPRLQLLRRREKLDEVVAGAATQFEAILRLNGWAHRQWESGGSFYYPPWDAVEILDLAREHDNHGFCAQYAIVLLQACQSMGIHARYVDLPGHFVVAAWSDDFDRWVILDPLYDIHYERHGTPMRGRDLYRAYWTEDLEGIVKVDSAGRRTAVTRADLNFFRLYSISLAANQLSAPVEVKINGAWRTLTHADDYRTYPKVGQDELVVASEFLAWRSIEATESFPERPETRDQDEFRYALNQTIILLANDRMTNRVLKVALLSSNSTTFDRFLLRSDQSGAWVPSGSATVKWLLSPGANQLFARIETTSGWHGTVSHLKVYYKPALFDFLPAFRGNILRISWHRAPART